MVKCPACGTPVNGDFGLFNCGNCGVPVLIGMESDASSVSPALPPIPTPPASATPPIPPAPPAPDETLIPEVQTVSVSPSLPPVPESLSEVPPATISKAAAINEAPPFQNSQPDDAVEGNFRYNLFISGIDSASVRQNIIEVLEDRKMTLNMNEILANIQNGELKISDITAIKCAVIVQKLKSLPIDMRWEQYDTHQNL